MSGAVRISLLVGCLGLSLLDAPRAGALLVQGVAGPYGRGRPALERAPAPAREEAASAGLPLAPGRLLAAERDAWSTGPLAGL